MTSLRRFSRIASLHAAIFLALVSGSSFGDAVSAQEAKPEAKAEPKAPAADPAGESKPGDDVTAEWERRVRKLIQDLGNSSFFVREAAQAQLAKMGYDIVDNLMAAKDNDDLEVAKRASYLLRGLRVEFREQIEDLRKNSPAEVGGPLMGYENDNEATRRKKLENLAKLSPELAIGPLCRLVQYEQSPMLAREAALYVLNIRLTEGPDGEKRAQTALKELGGCLRPGGDWVRAHVQARTQPVEALAVMERLTENEGAFLRKARHQTKEEIVLGLLKYQVELGRRTNREAQVRATRLKMIALEPGESRTLVDLVDELFQSGDFATLDQVAGQFSGKVNTNASLLYRMAEARKVLGKDQEAGELAEKARAINPADRTAHFRMAYDLGVRGLWDWSEKEAQQLAQLGLEGTNCNLALDETCATRVADPDAVRQLMADYLAVGEPVRRERIRALAELRPSAAVSPLTRIVRFEPSEVLAREAAAAILGQQPIDDLSWTAYSREIERTLGRGERTGARWLRSYQASRTAPEAALAEFTKFTQVEEETLEKTPAASNPMIVLSLLRLQYALLKRLDRLEVSQPVLARMTARDPGDEKSLGSLLDFFLNIEQPKYAADLALRAQERIGSNPILLYQRAEAFRLLKQTKEAEQYAQQANALIGGDQEKRNTVAAELSEKGLNYWAEKEYQELISTLPAEDTTSLNAKVRLASLAEDREDLDRAMSLLEDAHRILLDGVQQQRFRMVPNWIISRLHMCRAKRFGAKGDFAKQLEFLDLAIDVSPEDADVLIALHRVPQQDDERRKKTKEKIEAIVVKFREQIQAEPQNSTYYNQLAWLVGNTEGDQDEALRCSLKSLELRPGTAGYLDTLGHVYFARKDFENAVKYQSQAVELDPHSEQLSKQLKVFQAALKK